MARKSYSEAFKEEAVKLVTEKRVSRTQVARELGVDPGTLREWVAHAEGPPAGSPAEPVAQAEQLRRLERELERVRMERDILKKAIGIFSRVPGRGE